MHMADALLAPAVAVTMYAASGVTTGISINKIKNQEAVKTKLPMMAVASALVFAGQMINYTIPGTGSSGHICGGFLLTALLGPQAAFLSMVVILAIQCLFFGDGGLMALGANAWNMAFYGCFVGYYLIWRPIIKSRLFSKAGAVNAGRFKVVLASLLGCILTLQLGAFSVVLETLVSGITELPFTAFLSLMQPIHLAIGLVEGLATAAVLSFVYQARSELLMDISEEMYENRKSTAMKTVAIILTVVVALTAGVFSLFASSNPDGLEWSLFGNSESGYSENMGLDEEDYGLSSSLADKAQSIQDTTAILPDYAFKNSESALGTSVSGIVGSAAVALFLIGIASLCRLSRKKSVE